MSVREKSGSVENEQGAAEELRRLAEKHRQCEERLLQLKGRLFLSEQEKLEEVGLKKRKLMLKDRMAALSRDLAASGATGG